MYQKMASTQKRLPLMSSQSVQGISRASKFSIKIFSLVIPLKTTSGVRIPSSTQSCPKGLGEHSQSSRLMLVWNCVLYNSLRLQMDPTNNQLTVNTRNIGNELFIVNLMVWKWSKIILHSLLTSQPNYFHQFTQYGKRKHVYIHSYFVPFFLHVDSTNGIWQAHKSND